MKYLLFLLTVLSLGCGDGAQVYKVVGTVRSIKLDEQKAIIAHDTIPNLMMPMIMPFFIPDLEELDKIEIGDSVHFEFIWNDTKPFSRNFTIVGRGHIPDHDDFFDDEFSEKSIGSTIDDVSLLNLDSVKVSLSQTDGKHRFISYIFSRCPMPNLCPAIVLKNAALAHQFPEVEFIMVSFDYKYDTPAVLKKAYGPSVINYRNWDVWSSIGRIEDVYRLVKQSGGNFWGVEQEKIGHTLSSVLIGRNRELLGIWKGEDWKVDEVSNAINLLLK